MFIFFVVKYLGEKYEFVKKELKECNLWFVKFDCLIGLVENVFDMVGSLVMGLKFILVFIELYY